MADWANHVVLSVLGSFPLFPELFAQSPAVIAGAGLASGRTEHFSLRLVLFLLLQWLIASADIRGCALGMVRIWRGIGTGVDLLVFTCQNPA